MAIDPVEAARRRQQAMLSRSSYFPASNLRQFEGTELAPPGGGTYYNPSRYAGAPANIQRTAARSLANAYQQDLAFNVQANPRLAGGLQAERIGAQYGGGGSFANRPGYQTIYGPSGGSMVVSDLAAKRLLGLGGYSTTNPALAQSNIQRSYAQGYGAPAPTLQGGYLTQGGVANPVENLTPQQRTQFNVPSFTQTYFPAISALRGFGNAVSSFFNRGNTTAPSQPMYAAQQPPDLSQYSGLNRYFD